jgi:hypothetical protein
MAITMSNCHNRSLGSLTPNDHAHEDEDEDKNENENN